MIGFRIFRIVVVGAVGLFCLFGAFASFEPKADGSIHSGWLVFYLSLLVISSLSVFWDLFGIFRFLRDEMTEVEPEDPS